MSAYYLEARTQTQCQKGSFKQYTFVLSEQWVHSFLENQVDCVICSPGTYTTVLSESLSIFQDLREE